MPSSNYTNAKKYNLVTTDPLDTRIPIMTDNAFNQGIAFNCKFIGSMDIPRPTSRVEIVAAMRRVRFEYKQKGLKKKKVTVTVSTDGIKTTLRKRRSRKKRMVGRGGKYVDVDQSMLIQSHPIYRIFYVSHDSQDVKIFSYIARETSSNLFHCSVFKANKKAQAMRIVRTVGQAFEVCHKLVAPAHEHQEDDDVAPPPEPIKKEEKRKNFFQKLTDHGKRPADLNINKEPDLVNLSSPTTPTKQTKTPPPSPSHNSIREETNDIIDRDLVDIKLSSQWSTIDQKPPVDQQKQRSTELPSKKQWPVDQPPSNNWANIDQPPTSQWSTIDQQPPTNWSPVDQQPQSRSNISTTHDTQLLREKLDQQQQQTQAALAQINLLRDQLAAEAAARIEAQARTHQLLLHNKELLDHLQSLVRHIHQLEGTTQGGGQGGQGGGGGSGGGQERQQSGTNQLIQHSILPQLTPRSKIERWFTFSGVEEGTTSEPEMDEFIFDKKVRDSKRTLVSKGESGFVSDNSLNSKLTSSFIKRVFSFNFRQAPAGGGGSKAGVIIGGSGGGGGGRGSKNPRIKKGSRMERARKASHLQQKQISARKSSKVSSL